MNILFLQLCAVLVIVEATVPTPDCEDDSSPTTPTCPENEVYSDCKITCPPQTCESISAIYNCPLQNNSTCTPGCNCISGYLRNGTTTDPCIKSELCPNGNPEPQCTGLNEEPTDCYSPCQKTCKTRYRSGGKVCPTVCQNGCKCIDGYLKHDNGTCVPIFECSPALCDSNEEYTNCGSACEITCDNYKDTDRVCTLQCVEGCFCKNGLVRAQDGSCVEKSQCPSKVTGNNSGSSSTSSSSSSASSASSTSTSTSSSSAQSSAQSSTSSTSSGSQSSAQSSASAGSNSSSTSASSTSSSGSTTGTSNNTPKPPTNSCAENEVYSDCKIECPPQTCDSIRTTYQCPVYIQAQCTPGCDCINGYLRNGTASDPCIPSTECPPSTNPPLPLECPKNEVAVSCLIANCYQKCSDLNEPIACPAIADCDQPGCICQSGYLRLANGTCVPKEECPLKPCRDDEERKTCGTACEETCDNFDSPPRPCPALCVNGCFCKSGTIRASDGSCVQPENCPNEPVCRDDEERNTCGTSCEITCDNYNSPPEVCTDVCKDGCFCKSGTIRASDGSCVKPENCSTPIICGENEVRNTCGPACEERCPSRFKILVACIQKCVDGCFCKEGYVRAPNGNCIPSSECPKLPEECPANEVYTDCTANKCYKTCSDLNGPVSCEPVPNCNQPGCLCKEDYLRLDNGTCVPLEQCPGAPTDLCGQNEVFSTCKRQCPPEICDTLYSNYACFAPDDCRQGGCNCAPGYLRNGTASDPCIPVAECTKLVEPSNEPVCRDDEERNTCGTSCEITCDNYNSPPEACTAVCVDGCFCKNGTLRSSDGSCVAPRNCPDPICNADEERNDCGTACEVTCDNYGKPITCTKQCVKGCFCKDNKIRAPDGSCVDPSDCPVSPPTCKENEEYTDCGPYCPPQTCASLYIKYKCLSDIACISGCKCKEGYLRNGTSTDPCIPVGQCPGLPDPVCRDDEERQTCGTACEITCDNYNDPPEVCTDQCVDGCFCKSGTVRAADGSCVEPCDCPAQPVCGVNEVKTDCYDACQKTCKTRFRSDGKFCTQECRTGCNCIDGYLRHDNGTCVPTYQCSEPLCNPDEYHPDCGPSCEPTCATLNNTCRICTLRCADGCFCKPGLVRSDDGITCVKPEECPAPVCGEHEHFETCPEVCPPQTCEAITARYDCSKFRKCCQPQCRCDDGYTRNDQNVCVPTCDC